jgi:hypothetical protein
MAVIEVADARRRMWWREMERVWRLGEQHEKAIKGVV